MITRKKQQIPLIQFVKYYSYDIVIFILLFFCMMFIMSIAIHTFVKSQKKDIGKTKTEMTELPTKNSTSANTFMNNQKRYIKKIEKFFTDLLKERGVNYIETIILNLIATFTSFGIIRLFKRKRKNKIY